MELICLPICESCTSKVATLKCEVGGETFDVCVDCYPVALLERKREAVVVIAEPRFIWPRRW